jgi:drug/metabolite transporter (DMT)-like permease
MIRNHNLAYGKAFLAMLFWSFTFIWIKIALISYHPIEIVFLRLVLANALLFLAVVIMKHKEKPAKEDMLRFMAVAFFEPFCYFLGEANGMQFVSPTLGSLIISTIPIVTFIGAWLFLKEKVSVLLFLGLFISFAGVSVLALESKEIWATLKGVMLLFFAVLGGMFYGITVRKLTLKYETLTIVMWQSFWGMLYFLPLFLVFDAKDFFTMQHSGVGLLTIAAMSVFGSVGAFLLYTGVIRELGVIRSNLTTNLIPVLTALTSFLFLGDRPTFRAIIGILLVITGLIISQLRDIRKVILPAD